MNSGPSNVAAGPVTAPVSTADIDASCRHAVVFLSIKAAGWLVFGSLFALLASVRLHAPGMFAHAPWLGYGRLQPAAWNCWVYGFAVQAGWAAALWMLARLTGQPHRSGLLTLAGGALWNLGVFVGVVGILAGDNTGRPWFEMPGYAAPALLIGAVIVVASVLVLFAGRREDGLYISAWYVLAGLLGLVWFTLAARLLFAFQPPRGVLQMATQRWCANGLLSFSLGGLGLAVIFYQLPRLLERPLASRQLAQVGFWFFVFCLPWGGLWPGDPVPRWMISLCACGQIMAGIGVAATLLNWGQTIGGDARRLWASPFGRWILVGVGGYALWALATFALPFRPVSALLRFTWFEQGLDGLLVLGFLLPALVGILSEALPRVTARSLPAPGLETPHFWLTTGGIALFCLPLLIAGLIQGLGMQGDQATFDGALKMSLHAVRLSTLGLLLLLAGQALFVGRLALLAAELARDLAALAGAWAGLRATPRAARLKAARP